MLTSTKLILSGFLGVLACFALVLIGAIAGNRGAVSVTVTLLGIAALGLVVVLIVLAAGFVHAIRGLYRQPDLRTWSNIALAIGGLGGLALALAMLASALAARAQLRSQGPGASPRHCALARTNYRSTTRRPAGGWPAA